MGSFSDSAQLNHTHHPDLRSWVESANDPTTDFPIQNLPHGVFERCGDHAPRGGIAIGNSIFDLTAAIQAGFFSGDTEEAARLAASSSLNQFMSAGRAAQSAVRRRVSEILSTNSRDRRGIEKLRDRLLVPMDDVQMRLPAMIGNFTDFYTSICHTERGGRVLRPDNPIPPAFRYLPIGYHGRASSIRASEEPVRRPNGQRRTPNGHVIFGPSEQQDFELELGVFVGRGNELGEPISIEDAPDRIFGYCLLNDWSARDIQAWESVLGPFLSKSLSTTISCWVVTNEAMEPFRAPAFPRSTNDPPILPYLHSVADQSAGGLDVTMEAYLLTARMRREGSAPLRIVRTNFINMYWTFAQMLTHHASNGCNLRPGDLLGSGTASGPLDENRACLAEINGRGAQSFTLPNRENRTWLEDGDEVFLKARAERKGFVSIGFGECAAQLVAAPSWPIDKAR